MKRLQRISEAEVISEFLKNEFYQANFDSDRDKFERLVMEPDLTDRLENGVRRALLFRRRGHLWRELPPQIDWWAVKLEPQDFARIRVFPRAQWRKLGGGSFLVSDIVERIRKGHFAGRRLENFTAKVKALSYRLRREPDQSSILLIGIDEARPLTILEGNHRLAAAFLASPQVATAQFRVLAGFSPNMSQSCWYETNFETLWRYFKHRLRNVRDREADVQRVLQAVALAGAEPGLPVNAGEILEELHPEKPA